MTTEKAIELLKIQKGFYAELKADDLKDDIKALEIAIKSLEKQAEEEKSNYNNYVFERIRRRKGAADAKKQTTCRACRKI